MMYPRGPGTPDPRDPALVAHAVAVAADLGADLVKTMYPGSVAGMAAVTRAAAVPVLVAGGPASAAPEDFFAEVRQGLHGGARGGGGGPQTNPAGRRAGPPPHPPPPRPPPPKPPGGAAGKISRRGFTARG